MDENTMIDELEELIKSFGVQIRNEAIKQDEDLVYIVGGLCLLRGEYVLIINSKATTMDRIKTLATALKHFDLDQIYLRPVFRELLDKIPEQRRFNMNGEHPVILKEI
jgi:N-dimethylarginine dimethylaminohydrolase